MALLERLFGPLFVWEHTALARRKRYYWTRAGYATLLLFVFWVVLDDNRALSSGVDIARRAKIAFNLLVALGYVQILSVFFVAPLYVGAALPLERQRRRLDDLLTAGLTPREIVLGKWAARSVNLLSLLLTGLPLFCFLTFFGGVPFESLAVLSILIVGYVAAGSGVALLATASAQSARKGIVRAFCAIAALLFLYFPFALAWGPALPFLIWLHPFITWTIGTAVTNSGFALPGALLSLLVYGLFGRWCLSIAALWLGRVEREDVANPGNMMPHTNNVPPVPPVGDRPVFWKECYCDKSRSSRRPLKILLAWILLLGVPASFMHVWSINLELDSVDVSEMARGLGVLFYAIACCFAPATMAAQSICGERDRNCWDVLLSTPLSAREIVNDKLQAAMRFSVMGCLVLATTFAVAWYHRAFAAPALLAVLLAVADYTFFVSNLAMFHALRRLTTINVLLATYVSVFACVVGPLFVVVAFLIFVDGRYLASGWHVAATCAVTPIAVIWCVAFRWDDLACWSLAETIAIAVAIVGNLVLFAGLGWLLYRANIRHFARLAGRTDREAEPSRTDPSNRVSLRNQSQ